MATQGSGWGSEDELLQEGGISAFPPDQEEAIDEEALLGPEEDEEQGGQGNFNLDDLEDDDLIEVEIEGDDEQGMEDWLQTDDSADHTNHEEQTHPEEHNQPEETHDVTQQSHDYQEEGSHDHGDHDDLTGVDMKENIQIHVAGTEQEHEATEDRTVSDDESDEDEHQAGRRQRFKSERKQIVTMSRPKDVKIPETLELSAKDQAELTSHANSAPTNTGFYGNRGGFRQRGNYRNNMRGRPNILSMNVVRNNNNRMVPQQPMMGGRPSFQPLMSAQPIGRMQGGQGFMGNQMQRMGMMQGGNNMFNQQQQHFQQHMPLNPMNRFNQFQQPQQQPQQYIRPAIQSIRQPIPSIRQPIQSIRQPIQSIRQPIQSISDTQQEMDLRPSIRQSQSSGSIHVNPHFKGPIDMGASRQTHKRSLEETFGFFVEPTSVNQQRPDPLSLFSEVSQQTQRGQFNPGGGSYTQQQHTFQPQQQQFNQGMQSRPLSSQFTPHQQQQGSARSQTSQFSQSQGQTRSLMANHFQEPNSPPHQMNQPTSSFMQQQQSPPPTSEARLQPQPILGQNQGLMGQNQSLMGQNPGFMGQNSQSLMGQNNHSLMGQNNQSLMGQNNQSLMGQNNQSLMRERPALLQAPPQQMRSQFQQPEPRGQPIQTVMSRQQSVPGGAGVAREGPIVARGGARQAVTGRAGAGQATTSRGGAGQVSHGRGGSGPVNTGRGGALAGRGRTIPTLGSVGAAGVQPQQKGNIQQRLGAVKEFVSNTKGSNDNAPAPQIQLLESITPTPQASQSPHPLLQKQLTQEQKAEQSKRLARARRFGNLSEPAIKTDTNTVKTATKRLSTGNSEENSPPKQLKLTRTIINSPAQDKPLDYNSLYRQKQEEMKRKREEILKRKEAHRQQRMAGSAESPATSTSQNQGQQGQKVNTHNQAGQKVNQNPKNWVPQIQQQVDPNIQGSRQQQVKQLLQQKNKGSPQNMGQQRPPLMGRGGNLGGGNNNNIQPLGRGANMGRGHQMMQGVGRGNNMQGVGRGNMGQQQGKPVKKLLLTKAQIMKFQGFGRGQNQNQRQKTPNRQVHLATVASANPSPPRKVVNTAASAPSSAGGHKPNNRTVIEAPVSRKVVIEGLASTTNRNSLANMAKAVGPFINIQMDSGNRKAVITFQNPDQARLFAATRDRSMVDLARIRAYITPE